MPRPGISWLASDTGFYYVVLAVAALACLLVWAVYHSRLGLLLRGLADSPLALSTMGTTVNVTYSAVDWNQNSNPPGPAALGNLGRNENVGATGNSFTYGKPVPFAMYETGLNLLAMGLSNLTLQSVTFNGLAGNAAVTGVFAISATPVPEPSTLLLCGLGGLGILGLAWRRSKLAV